MTRDMNTCRRYKQPAYRVYWAAMEISEGHGNPYTVTVHLADRYPRREPQHVVDELGIQLEVT